MPASATQNRIETLIRMEDLIPAREFTKEGTVERLVVAVMLMTHAPETGAGFWSVCHGH